MSPGRTSKYYTPVDPASAKLNQEIQIDRRKLAHHRELCRDPRCPCGAAAGLPAPDPEPVETMVYHVTGSFSDGMACDRCGDIENTADIVLTGDLALCRRCSRGG